MTICDLNQHMVHRVVFLFKIRSAFPVSIAEKCFIGCYFDPLSCTVLWKCLAP